MRQLNKIENTILLFGAVMMVIGSGANIFAQPWAPYVFGNGAVIEKHTYLSGRDNKEDEESEEVED